MLSRSEQRRIMREDRKRRFAREQADIEAFVASHSPRTYDPSTYVNPELVRGIGV